MLQISGIIAPVKQNRLSDLFRRIVLQNEVKLIVFQFAEYLHIFRF